MGGWVAGCMCVCVRVRAEALLSEGEHCGVCPGEHYRQLAVRVRVCVVALVGVCVGLGGCVGGWVAGCMCVCVRVRGEAREVAALLSEGEHCGVRPGVHHFQLAISVCVCVWCAWAWLCRRTDWRSSCHLCSPLLMSVRPFYQRRGIGTAIVRMHTQHRHANVNDSQTQTTCFTFSFSIVSSTLTL